MTRAPAGNSGRTSAARESNQRDAARTRWADLSDLLRDCISLRAAPGYLRRQHGLDFTAAQLRAMTLAGIGPLGSVALSLVTCPVGLHRETWARWARWAKPRARILQASYPDKRRRARRARAKKKKHNR